MTKAKAIKKICGLVIEYLETENYEVLRRAESIAYDYDVFMAFDEEYIAVEDDVFYFNN